MIINHILTVASVCASWWSFSSKPWNSLALMQWGAIIATLILTAGAIIEYWEKLKQLLRLSGKWVRGKSNEFERCVFKKLVVHSLGPILVVIGIAGEVVFEGRAFILEDRQEEQAQQAIGSVLDLAEAARQKADSFERDIALASKQAGDAKTSADGAAEDAIRAKSAADFAQSEVEALSPRSLSIEQQQNIADVLKQLRGSHPTVIGSYGMDGEGTALATQIIRAFEATGRGMPTDERANQVVSGGFEWGISIRGPANEMPYMLALRDALVNIGKLEQVSINGPSPRVGAGISGAAGISGNAGIFGGGGPPVQQPIPTTGPVRVLVGIRPPPVLPQSGKQ